MSPGNAVMPALRACTFANVQAGKQADKQTSKQAATPSQSVLRAASEHQPDAGGWQWQYLRYSQFVLIFGGRKLDPAQGQGGFLC